MSEITKEIRKGCDIQTLSYEGSDKSITFKATLRGSLEVKDVWSVGPYVTQVLGHKVSLESFVKTCLERYFMVRMINAPLKKGTKVDAVEALKKGFDWSQSHVKEAKQLSPAQLGEKAISMITGPEQLQELIRMAQLKLAQLEEPQTTDTEAEAEANE